MGFIPDRIVDRKLGILRPKLTKAQSALRDRIRAKTWRRRTKSGPVETVEEYLARGGAVTKVAPAFAGATLGSDDIIKGMMSKGHGGS